MTSRRTLLAAIAATLLLTGCPPKQTQPPVTAIGLAWTSTDYRHDDTASSLVVERDGCYARKHDDPRMGNREQRACLPKQRVDKWITQLDAIKNKRGQTKRGQTNPATTRQLHVSRKLTRRSFSLDGNNADPRLRALANRVNRATTTHWATSKPQVGAQHPLGFSMVSLTSRSKHGTYRAIIDATGRWRCSIDGYPFPISGRFTFSADTYRFAGRVTANAAHTLFTNLFAGVDTTTRSSSAPKVGMFATVDNKRELSAAAAATLLNRWRKLGNSLSADCAMKNR